MRFNAVPFDMHKTRRLLCDVLVFYVLVCGAAVGRWLAPELGWWNATPTAAATVFAAYYLSAWWAAALVPAAVLAVSNLFLPSYNDATMTASIYAAMLVPLACGWWLRRRFSAVRLAASCVAPAVTFFLSTNFAYWLTSGRYAPTWDGLLTCYAAAVPFFRNMLVGDVAFTLLAFAGYALVASARQHLGRSASTSGSNALG